jgi:hypothetical protein
MRHNSTREEDENERNGSVKCGRAALTSIQNGSTLIQRISSEPFPHQGSEPVNKVEPFFIQCPAALKNDLTMKSTANHARDGAFRAADMRIRGAGPVNGIACGAPISPLLACRADRSTY